MKNYLAALQKLEDNNNSLGLLSDFINDKKSNIIDMYCDGQMHLPSFMLLKKLRLKFTDLVNQDKELECLFSNVIKCSKLFYKRTIYSIQESNNNHTNFERLFEQQVQPLGQALINILLTIKYRVTAIRLNQKNDKVKRLLRFTKIFSKIIAPTITQINNYVYKIRLIQSTYNNISRKIYYLVVSITLSSFLGVNFYLLPDKSALLTVIVNIMFCMAITLLAMLTYPVYNFGLIDIKGKNIVAYNYRAFFNNLSNKKMYKIFTLQNIPDTGQFFDESVDSPTTETS